MTQRRILIADDSSTIRRVVTHAFAGTDVDVLTAAHGREALEIARAEVPELILCDVVMPELSGYEVIEALRDDPRTASIPALLLTGAFEPFDRERSEACGANGHLSKPFETHVLIRQVEEHLAETRNRAEEEPSASMAEEHGLEAPIPTLPNTRPSPLLDSLPDESPLGCLGSAHRERDFLPPAAPPLPGDANFHFGDKNPSPSEDSSSGDSPLSRLSEAEFRAQIQEEVRREIRDRASSIIREVAWEVVPDLLERLLRESVPTHAEKHEEE